MKKSVRRSGRVFVWIIAAIAALGMAVLLGYGVWYYKASGVEQHGVELKERPGFRAVHLHAALYIAVCGQERKVPVNRGTALLHTHRDANRIHIEGAIAGPQDVTLGKFMEALDVPFGRDYVFEVRNGSACPDGQSGTWKMSVNGVQGEEFGSYAINDSDVIELRFNP